MNRLKTITDPNQTTASDMALEASVAQMDSIHRATTKTATGETKGTNVWHVSLRRHGKRIDRTFAEARWGGREAALAAAQDWRDAVVADIPPITNHHAATRIGTRNTTGISGVLRSTPRHNPRGTMWIATLTTRDGQKKQAFSVATYGKDGARERAIAQRQKWLSELPPRYFTMCDTSRAALAGHPVPAVAPTLAPMPLMTPEEIDARVAVINADFDARMPRRLRWRVRAQNAARPNGPLVVALSDAGFPARRHSRTVCPRERPLSEMLAEAIERLRADAINLHGTDIADWFIKTHIEPALTPERFDSVTGFTGCVMVTEDEQI